MMGYHVLNKKKSIGNRKTLKGAKKLKKTYSKYHKELHIVQGGYDTPMRKIGLRKSKKERSMFERLFGKVIE